MESQTPAATPLLHASFPDDRSGCSRIQRQAGRKWTPNEILYTTRATSLLFAVLGRIVGLQIRDNSSLLSSGMFAPRALFILFTSASHVAAGSGGDR
jgi:hypothetical protein